MKSLIEIEQKPDELLKGFLTFDIKEDLENLNKLIIKEYTKNTFYKDLNMWLMNSKILYYESIGYFTARLMYSLNSYAETNNAYFKSNNIKVYRGIKIPYSCLLQYERAKNKIIVFSSFTSTSLDKSIANNFSSRDERLSLYKANLKFSVIFHIKHKYKNNWISNGINIQKEAYYYSEKEILFQPFCFYLVEDVKIDIKNYTGDIYLKTIGKTEILEEKIKLKKDIYYNEKEKIMKIRK